MIEGKLSLGSSQELVIKYFQRTSTTVDLEIHKGKYILGSDYYFLRSQKRQNASKSNKQLNKTSPGPLQTKFGPSFS